MDRIVVRLAHPADAEPAREIYNWAVAHTTASLDIQPRNVEQQKEWMAAHDGNPYPVLVADRTEEPQRVLGYASLSPYNSKPGYSLSAEVSVYVHPDWHRRGVGNALLAALIQEAQSRGFANLIALITADNAASLQLHMRHGFKTAGTLEKVGRKFDRWVDVTLMQLLLPRATL